MAEQIETVSLIKFQVEGATSVADLKENIKQLKTVVNEAEIGSEQYQKALALLRENQNAVRDAAYAEKAGLDAVIQSAKGASTSYNSLVNKMAELKREFRATGDEARRMELGQQINEINDQLKAMDALQGNFQRNVGNYQSALNGLGDVLKGLPPTLGAVKEKAGQVGETIGIIGKQPLLGLIGLIAPILMKIAGALKENQTAMDAVQKAMKALEPVFNLVSGVLEKIAQFVADAVGKFVELAGESGETFKKIVSGAVGVGNVLLQFILTPIRNIVEAFKGLGNILKDVFTGNFKKIKEDATEAFNGIKESFVKGFSFKENFDLGKQVGEQFASGLKSSKKAAGDAAKEIREEIDNALKEVDVDSFDDKEDIGLKKRVEAEKAAAKEEAELLKVMSEQEQETIDEIDKAWDEYMQNRKEDDERDKKSREDRINSLQAIAGATASLFDHMADLYEADAEASEKSERQAKNLRIAGAVIDTISGAIGAYMQAVKSFPAPYGVIMGAIQAATVTAAGLAQINKIRSTTVSRNGASNVTVTPMATQAPAFAPSVPQTTVMNSSSDELRLNRMASNKKVYLVVSELEAKQEDMKVQLAEATF